MRKWTCFFRHCFIPQKAFWTNMTDPHSGTIVGYQSHLHGLECGDCGLRKLKKVRSDTPSVGETQAAYDWLNERIKPRSATYLTLVK